MLRDHVLIVLGKTESTLADYILTRVINQPVDGKEQLTGCCHDIRVGDRSCTPFFRLLINP